MQGEFAVGEDVVTSMTIETFKLYNDAQRTWLSLKPYTLINIISIQCIHRNSC